MDYKHFIDDVHIFTRHWSETAALTDAVIFGRSELPGQILTENELLPGELSASVFEVGCYTVRSAHRFYRIHEPGYLPETEMPAEKAEVDLIRKKGCPDRNSFGLEPRWMDWSNKLRITHEISAKHNASPSSIFTYICRASQARNYRWSESIGSVYTVKENDMIPDEYASLLVCNTYMGDLFSFDTWYKLDPTGKITTLRLHPYDSNKEEARFTDLAQN